MKLLSEIKKLHLIAGKVLNVCKDMIINKIGTLDDVPYELANTVANIYYKLCLLLKINRSLGWWPRYDKHYEDKDPTKNMIKFIVSYNKLKADIISIP